MDLKTYYRKLRELEATLPEEVVIVSKDTPDGGRAGRLTHAPRSIAARFIAEGFATQASDEQTEQFHKELHEARENEHRRRAAANVQVNIITAEQARAIAPPTSQTERS